MLNFELIFKLDIFSWKRRSNYVLVLMQLKTPVNGYLDFGCYYTGILYYLRCIYAVYF